MGRVCNYDEAVLLCLRGSPRLVARPVRVRFKGLKGAMVAGMLKHMVQKWTAQALGCSSTRLKRFKGRKGINEKH